MTAPIYPADTIWSCQSKKVLTQNLAKSELPPPSAKGHENNVANFISATRKNLGFNPKKILLPPLCHLLGKELTEKETQALFEKAQSNFNSKRENFFKGLLDLIKPSLFYGLDKGYDEPFFNAFLIRLDYYLHLAKEKKWISEEFYAAAKEVIPFDPPPVSSFFLQGVLRTSEVGVSYFPYALSRFSTPPAKSLPKEISFSDFKKTLPLPSMIQGQIWLHDSLAAFCDKFEASDEQLKWLPYFLNWIEGKDRSKLLALSKVIWEVNPSWFRQNAPLLASKATAEDFQTHLLAPLTFIQRLNFFTKAWESLSKESVAKAFENLTFRNQFVAFIQNATDQATTPTDFLTLYQKFEPLIEEASCFAPKIQKSLLDAAKRINLTECESDRALLFLKSCAVSASPSEKTALRVCGMCKEYLEKSDTLDKSLPPDESPFEEALIVLTDKFGDSLGLSDLFCRRLALIKKEKQPPSYHFNKLNRFFCRFSHLFSDTTIQEYLKFLSNLKVYTESSSAWLGSALGALINNRYFSFPLLSTLLQLNLPSELKDKLEAIVYDLIKKSPYNRNLIEKFLPLSKGRKTFQEKLVSLYLLQISDSSILRAFLEAAMKVDLEKTSVALIEKKIAPIEIASIENLEAYPSYRMWGDAFLAFREKNHLVASRNNLVKMIYDRDPKLTHFPSYPDFLQECILATSPLPYLNSENMWDLLGTFKRTPYFEPVLQWILPRMETTRLESFLGYLSKGIERKLDHEKSVREYVGLLRSVEEVHGPKRCQETVRLLIKLSERPLKGEVLEALFSLYQHISQDRNSDIDQDLLPALFTAIENIYPTLLKQKRAPASPLWLIQFNYPGSLIPLLSPWIEKEGERKFKADWDLLEFHEKDFYFFKIHSDFVSDFARLFTEKEESQVYKAFNEIISTAFGIGKPIHDSLSRYSLYDYYLSKSRDQIAKEFVDIASYIEEKQATPSDFENLFLGDQLHSSASILVFQAIKYYQKNNWQSQEMSSKEFMEKCTKIGSLLITLKIESSNYFHRFILCDQAPFKAYQISLENKEHLNSTVDPRTHAFYYPISGSTGLCAVRGFFIFSSEIKERLRKTPFAVADDFEFPLKVIEKASRFQPILIYAEMESIFELAFNSLKRAKRLTLQDLRTFLKLNYYLLQRNKYPSKACFEQVLQGCKLFFKDLKVGKTSQSPSTYYYSLAIQYLKIAKKARVFEFLTQKELEAIPYFLLQKLISDPYLPPGLFCMLTKNYPVNPDKPFLLFLSVYNEAFRRFSPVPNEEEESEAPMPKLFAAFHELDHLPYSTIGGNNVGEMLVSIGMLQELLIENRRTYLETFEETLDCPNLVDANILRHLTYQQALQLALLSLQIGDHNPDPYVLDPTPRMIESIVERAKMSRSVFQKFSLSYARFYGHILEHFDFKPARAIFQNSLMELNFESLAKHFKDESRRKDLNHFKKSLLPLVERYKVPLPEDLCDQPLD